MPDTIASPSRTKQNRDLIDIVVTEKLRFRYCAGSGSDLVISFASIGKRRAQMPPDEFVGTVLGDPTRNALFVSDLGRSWMNDPDLCDRLRDTVGNLIARHGITRISTLGLSMGAFSALTASDLFDVDAAIAFSPQFSMRSALIPGEGRWSFWRRRLKDYRFETAEAASPATHSFLFHGLLDDAVHMQAFTSRNGLDQFVFPEQSHSTLCGHLKNSGVLGPIVAAASKDDRRRVARLAKSCGGMWRGTFDRQSRQTRSQARSDK